MPYFHYRSLDELRADIAAREYAIAVGDRLERVVAPVRIGAFTASNRMAIHPMEGCDGNAARLSLAHESDNGSEILDSGCGFTVC